MTKAEQKKLETAERRSFCTEVYKTVLDSIPKVTEGDGHTIQIRISHNNRNRYIKFHAYGRDMNILIFGDGNIRLEMKEFCHSEYQEQLFEYERDKENASAWLEKCKSLYPLLVSIFWEQQIDFHTYMDFVEEYSDAEKAFDEVKKAFSKEEEN